MSEALTSSDDITDGFYVLRNVGHATFLRGYQNTMDDDQLYLKNVSSSDSYSTFSQEFIGISNADKMDYVLHFTKNTDGTFQIQCNTGKYLPTEFLATWSESKNTFTGNSAPKASAEAGAISFGVISGTSFWMKSPKGCYADGNGSGKHSEGEFVGYHENVPTEANSNSAYQIYPVSLEEGVAIAAQFTAVDADNNVLATKEVKCMDGSEVTNPFTDADVSYFYTNPQFKESNITVTSDNHTFTVQYTASEAPFEFSTASNPKWYRIYFKNDKSHNLVFVGDAQKRINAQTAFNAEAFAKVSGQTADDCYNGALWAFIHGENGGVMLLNKQTALYVNTQEDGSYTGYNQDRAVLSQTPALFTVQTNNQGGFSMSIQGTKHACMGDHLNGLCGLWQKDDAETWNNASSSWRVAAADDDEQLSVGKSVKSGMLENLLNKLQSADAKYVTTTSADAINAEMAKLQSVSNIESLDAIKVKWTNPQFEEGAYYLVRNVNWTDDENAYISTEGMKVGMNGSLNTDYDSEGNRNIRRKTTSASLISQLWNFVNKGNESYLVQNANTQCCLSEYQYSGMTMDMPTSSSNGGTMKFTTVNATFADAHRDVTNDQLTMFQMVEQQHNLRVGARDASGTVLGGTASNSDTDASNYWQFVKVSFIPVSISSVGWTSIALPFEVTIPSESTVKAFYATNVADGTIELQEVTDNVIPANQGVLLYNADGEATVNLSITNTGATLPAANRFGAATAMRAGFESLDTYLLAKKSNGEAGFLHSKLTYVPANKAYVDAADIPSSTSILGFRFGGESTGIEGVEAKPASSERYFDLNGRPVLYPLHGIYVTSKGNKVLFK